jgi:hypothetical protein
MQKDRGNLQGIKIGSILLTHLLFVYDILLFLNGFKREEIQEILNTFCVVTGMEINVKKSTYNFNGLREEVVQRLIIMLYVRVIDMHEGLKCLGFCSTT